MPFNVIGTEEELHRVFMIQSDVVPYIGISRCVSALTNDDDSCYTLFLGNCHLSPTLLSKSLGKLSNMQGLLIHFSLLNCHDATNIHSSR